MVLEIICNCIQDISSITFAFSNLAVNSYEQDNSKSMAAIYGRTINVLHMFWGQLLTRSKLSVVSEEILEPIKF